MKWTPYGFFFEKNEFGHIRPNWHYYMLVMHSDYGKKIRQHGKARKRTARRSGQPKP